MHIGESIKDKATEKYGEPPYGHAELSSLKTFSKRMGIDLQAGMESLKNAGYTPENEMQTLQSLATAYGIAPKHIYEVMAPQKSQNKMISGESKTLPEQPVAGTGNLTLADFCSQYQLNMKSIIRELKALGITASEEMTLKQVGEANQRGTADIYEHIRQLSLKK